MKNLIISDIHGSEDALVEVLKLYNRKEFDKIIICGDILYHGARNPLPEGHNPKGVIEILNSLKGSIIAVKGNCESEVDQMVMEFPVMGEYSYYKVGKRTIFITHGHSIGPDSTPPLNLGDIFLSGHTHIPMAEKRNGINLLNPGSISLPKGGYDPSYGILTEKSFRVFSLKKDEIICELDF